MKAAQEEQAERWGGDPDQGGEKRVSGRAWPTAYLPWGNQAGVSEDCPYHPRWGLATKISWATLMMKSFCGMLEVNWELRGR